MRKHFTFFLAVFLCVGAVLGLIGGCRTTQRLESGTASAEAQGFGGPITVTVTASEGRITGVTAEGPAETPGIGGRAGKTHRRFTATGKNEAGNLYRFQYGPCPLQRDQSQRYGG